MQKSSISLIYPSMSSLPWVPTHDRRDRIEAARLSGRVRAPRGLPQ